MQNESSSNSSPVDMTNQEEAVRIAAEYIQKAFEFHDKEDVPKISIVLGSGLGGFPKILTDMKTISYNDIPHMPKVTVQGHDGQLILGTIGGNNRILCFAGRVHSYEGIPWTQVCFQVQLMSHLGCKLFVLTNATGGLLDGMYEPCFMVIRDHIRTLARIDPTSRILSLDTIATLDSAKYEPLAPPEYWSDDINDLAVQIARDNDIEVFEGNYSWTSGPSYETPAEVMFMKKLGGGSVGMSTVPEVMAAMAASRGDLQVFGLSMVTNLGAGISVKHLTHEEVEQNAKKAMSNFQGLVEKVVMKAFGKLVSADETPKATVPEQKAINAAMRKRDGDIPLSLSDISEAADQIKSSIGQPTVPVAFVVPTRRAFDDIVDQASIQELPLKDVKNFSSVLKSLAGNVATVLTGTLVRDSNQRVLVIECLDVEGFGTRESAFLALLLSHLKIDSAMTTLHAESTTEDKKIMFGVMDDFVNFSARTRPLKFLLNMVNDVKTTNIFPESLSGFFSDGEPTSLNKHCYMSFSGPMRPSRTEREMAHMLGCDTAGVASLSLVYNLRFLNIKTLPIIMNSLGSRDKLATVVKSVLDNVFTLKNNMAQHNQQLKDDQAPLNVYVNLTNLRHSEASHVLNHVTKQLDDAGIDYADVHQKATSAVIDMNLGLDMEKRFNNVICSIPVRDLPHFSQYFSASKDLSGVALELVRTGEEGFCWIVRGGLANDNLEPAYACDVQLFVRLFQVMGIKQLVYCQAVISLEESEQAVGKCITISDQVNFTGENPLTGHNDSNFGMRFPDMSECFNRELNKELAEFLGREGLEVEKETCFFTNSLAERHSDVMKKSAELRIIAREVAKCGVASSVGAKEMIVTRHMFADRRIRASMVAIATDSLVDGKQGQDNVADSKSKVVNALAHWAQGSQ